MVQLLAPTPFSADLIHEVQSLDCRKNDDDIWGAESNRWIKGSADEEDSASCAIARARKPCRVWLYRLVETGQLVGFGSVGETRWPLGPDNDFRNVLIIPHLGMDRAFHGKPEDAPDGAKFSHQLLYHLIEVSERDGADGLGLWVDESNVWAKALYDKFRFKVVGKRITDGVRLEKRYRPNLANR